MGWSGGVLSKSGLIRIKQKHCTKCDYQFKVGDRVHRQGNKHEVRYLCDECYEGLFIDV